MEYLEDRTKRLTDHLFAELSIVSTLQEREFRVDGRNMRKTYRDDKTNNVSEYLDVTPQNNVNADECTLKKNIVRVADDYVTPLIVGVDAFMSSPVTLELGNTRYAFGTVLSCVAQGQVSEKLLQNFTELTRFCLLFSDKRFGQKRNSPLILFDHNELQEDIINMLKVVKENKMFYDLMEDIVELLHAHSYRYSPGDKESVILIRDGPILGDWNDAFADTLLKENIHGRFEYTHRFYKMIYSSGVRGVPIVGITKAAHRSVIGAHFGEKDILDYAILRRFAGNDTYFYVGPFRQQFGAVGNLSVLQYFLFLEKELSPLRIEILEGSLPAGVNPTRIVEDILSSLARDNAGLCIQNGENFKLPYGLTEADQQVREIVKRKNEELKEAMEGVRAKHAPECYIRQW